MNKKINSFTNNIWNKEAKKQLENEISFCLKEKIELPDGKDYLKMYAETHKTDEQIIEDLQQELERYKNIIDKIKILSNQVKEEAKEVENEWCYQVMKEIDYLIELKGE